MIFLDMPIDSHNINNHMKMYYKIGIQKLYKVCLIVKKITSRIKNIMQILKIEKS